MEISHLSTLVLRISLGLSFILTSLFILKSEDKWTGFIPSWAKKLTPTSPKTTMIIVAVFDLIVGIWLISGFYLWIAAFLAALHLIQVLIVTGINSVTYRDIGLLGASIVLFLIAV